MKYIIVLPSSLEQKVRGYIERGEFKDVNHFIVVAVENQINAEEGQPAWTTGKERPEASQAPTLSISATIRTKPMEAKIAPEPALTKIAGELLWGQFYRFLPAKVSLRVLNGMSETEFPTLATFAERACDASQEFGKQLKKLDKSLGNKSGEKLATSFPDSDEKSRRRFTEHYIGSVRRSDGKLVGMLPSLRFVDIWHQNGAERVGLTETGVKFCGMQNPVVDRDPPGVDRDSPSTFTIGEIDFLVAHIKEKLPHEAAHMATVLEMLNGGGKSRADVNEALQKFYSRYQDSKNPWTEGVINLMRAGVMSRLFEMGLIEKSRSGLLVTYKISELGKNYLPELSEAVEATS